MTVDPEILAKWQQIARIRLTNILSAHGVANARTIEQKISDAGPSNQRTDPHILTPVLRDLVAKKVVNVRQRLGAPWYVLADTHPVTVQERLEAQLPVYRRLNRGKLPLRIGQALEIAIYRALGSQNNLEYLGAFRDLENHDDSRLYRKEEPPRSLSGMRLVGDQNVDFLARHPEAGWAAIEAKNVRPWVYPNDDEIRVLLAKAVALDCVPVLIARRFAFVTFKVLWSCGVVFHQNYNQLLPQTAAELAQQVKDRNLLGYHDIRLGNEPDQRLQKFIGTNLPEVLPEARARFDHYKDLLEAFANNEMEYKEFAARVRRRSEGRFEDGDWDPPDNWEDLI